MNTRRKKIRKDRLAILLVLCAVVITTIGFGIWKISGMLFHDPYETYKAYETKGKDYGDIQPVSYTHLHALPDKHKAACANIIRHRCSFIHQLFSIAIRL